MNYPYPPAKGGAGGDDAAAWPGSTGGLYGGGAAGGYHGTTGGLPGANGAVRIIWGTNRTFPADST